MLFAIKAYEDKYGGYHGICQHFIVDVDSEQQAEEEALTASLEVMEDYSNLGIIEQIKDEITNCFTEEDDFSEEEFDKQLEEAMLENVAYEIYLIKNTYEKTIGELENEFWNNEKEFVAKYC